MSQPEVSVILATYNASHLLRYALGSLLRQTHESWEAIVVGDCCTDDTEEMIASLNDPRIRFQNLPENSGQQARPNNVGCELARGEFLAFLNHDDFYLPEHLERALSRLKESESDLLISPVAEIPVEQSEGVERDEIVARLS